MTPLEVELYRSLAANPSRAGEMLDVFSRARRPSEAFPLYRMAPLVARALGRPGADRPAIIRLAAGELTRAVVGRAERARVRLVPRRLWRL